VRRGDHARQLAAEIGHLLVKRVKVALRCRKLLAGGGQRARDLAGLVARRPVLLNVSRTGKRVS
jgi:hypothetical protein